MSWVKFLNIFILQLFFIRLTRCSQVVVSDYKLFSYDLTPGGISPRGVGTSKTHSWLSIQGIIVPFTGWNSEFIYIGKPIFLKISKVKIS